MKLIPTPKRMRHFFGVSLAAVIVLIVLLFIGGYTTRALALVQRPLIVVGTWVSDLSGGLRSRSALIAENRDLQNKVLALTVFETELENLRDENTSLKLQLGYIMETDLIQVTAHVTARQVSPDASVISVDRGSDDGLAVGDPVIVQEGVIIGKISQVTSKSATVRLLSDRHSNAAATILNHDRTLGIVAGSSGALLNFDFIPQNTKLDVNDVVITSGLEESVPYGLVIGVINSISSNETDPFKQAVIESVVDYRRYTMVSVIIGANEL
ncbi:rod shape-determining protein MreC [Patescibacteria group bacterium]|nr:rod shape-determining protein MreC [Patescibacteria group bacterium]MBU1906702.1 rod shape-determining protein MreC [Patescibacteria group bacterium]